MKISVKKPNKDLCCNDANNVTYYKNERKYMSMLSMLSPGCCNVLS